MCVIFLGNSQLRHIQKIYQSEGWICDRPSASPRAILRKLMHLKKILKADIVYCVGGSYSNTSFTRMARRLRKKIVVHWIGTDVLLAMDQPQRKIYREDMHLTCAEMLREELQTIGISSVVIPIVPNDLKFSPLPMPDKHAVLAYIPETREEFYGMPLLKKLARQLPDVAFHVVANSGKHDENPCPNVFYEGALNRAAMQAMYEGCSILFRYPQHDGLSMMVLEALGMGRAVIWKYKFPFVKTPSDDTFPSILKTFEEVLNAPPYLDQEASDYINSAFSMEDQVRRYKNAGLL